MIVVDCKQGTPEWLNARLGVATASCFEKVLTPAGKPSSQADAYANQLIAEWLCGEPEETFKSPWMERGNELEPEARAFYSMETGLTVKQAGFCLRDDGLVGCSPDGLIGDEGLQEIKCPAPPTHVGYLISGDVPKKYIPQIQGQLYVTGAQWCDFLSYHPVMPPVLIRIGRDETYIAALEKEIKKLLKKIEARKQILIKKGVEPISEAA